MSFTVHLINEQLLYTSSVKLPNVTSNYCEIDGQVNTGNFLGKKLVFRLRFLFLAPVSYTHLDVYKRQT